MSELYNLVSRMCKLYSSRSWYHCPCDLPVNIVNNWFSSSIAPNHHIQTCISRNVSTIGIFCYLVSWKILYDDVIKWKHFPRYWPFVRGIHRPPVNSPHKGQWRGALMFPLIYAWINGWVNNREASDLRRHRAHYDITLMNWKDNGPKDPFYYQRLVEPAPG